jgi:hypothetical protein
MVSVSEIAASTSTIELVELALPVGRGRFEELVGELEKEAFILGGEVFFLTPDS